MLLGYVYVETKINDGKKSSHPPAILIAMVARRSNTKRIAQCNMPRASPEATGHGHWGTTHSVLPLRPPGQQSTKRRCKIHRLNWPFQWPLQGGGTIPSASTDK
jgi:hypothetical protein